VFPLRSTICNQYYAGVALFVSVRTNFELICSESRNQKIPKETTMLLENHIAVTGAGSGIGGKCGAAVDAGEPPP
jgi:hypothetical protein